MAQNLVYSPEGENDETADEKYGGKDEKQGVTGLRPSGIRKHLSRLKTNEMKQKLQSDKVVWVNFVKKYSEMIQCLGFASRQSGWRGGV